MALRAGYYGVKRALKDKLTEIAGSWDSTIASLFPRNEQAILGAKNLLKITGSSTEINGITFTVNSDQSITVNGTATGTAVFYVGWRPFSTDKDVILSGCPSGGSKTTFRLDVGSQDLADIGNGSVIPAGYSSGEGCRIVIFTGVQMTDKKFYPMIRLATDKDNTFAPYAKTNLELTLAQTDDETALSNHKTTINAIISAATGVADFAAFKTAMGAITPVTRSLSTAAAPEEIVKDEIEEPVVEKKTTTRKKSTAKADTTKEV